MAFKSSLPLAVAFHLVNPLLLPPTYSRCQHYPPMVKTLKIGEDTFRIIQQYGATTDRLLFLNVHENEATSIEAIEQYSKETPVHFIRIAHEQTRRLKFQLNGAHYSVDPNRIYTRKGRRKTLQDGGSFSLKAARQVRQFARQLLHYLNGRSGVVAMHNNADTGYSIASYLPEGEEARNTAAIYINPQMRPNDFIYTTVPSFFQLLKERAINVVLQDNRSVVDDGSLSVYCGMKGIPYINIEAQSGHLEVQLHMLREVVKVLRSSGK